MSHKAIKEGDYATNNGDYSPLNISHVSEGFSASPVRVANLHHSKTNNPANYNNVSAQNPEIQDEREPSTYEQAETTNQNLSASQPAIARCNTSSIQLILYFHLPPVSVGTSIHLLSLGLMTNHNLMNGKSPKEFALSQVYGRPPQAAPSAKKPGYHKQSQSMSLSYSQRMNGSDRLDSHERFNTFENPHINQQNEIAPSKYTLKSKALMNSVLNGDSISQTHLQADRNQPSGGRVEGNLLLSDQQMYNFDKENKQKAHVRAQSQKEKQLIERLSNTQASALEKEQLKYYNEQEKMLECTFSPRFYSSIYSAGNTAGSVQLTASNQLIPKREPEFYQQQVKMMTQYENHLDQLRQSKEQEISGIVQEKPKISRKTKQLSEIALEKRGLQEIHVVDRLHYEKMIPEASKDTNTYKPQVSAYANSKIRHQRVDLQLYDDAKKRQQEKKSGKVAVVDKKKSAEEAKAKAIEAENALKKKKKNDRVVASRFDRDFQQAVGNIAFTKDPTRASMPETITYLEMIEILQQLKFVNKVNSESENPIVATQVQRVWNQLSSQIENKPRVLVRNLEVFLFAVQNIKADADLIPFVSEHDLNDEDRPSTQLNPDESSPRTQQYNENMYAINKRIAEQAGVINSKLSDSKRLPIGQFDQNDNLHYTDDQVAIVHKLFKDIGDNRLTGEKQQVVKNAVPTHSFAPAISNTSRRLAQEKRERVVGDLKSNEGFDGAPVDMNEILRYQQQLTRYQNEQQKSRLEEEQLRECTFHPQTKDFRLVEKYFSPRFGSQNTLDEDAVRSREGTGQAAPAGEGRRPHGPPSSTKSLGINRSIELFALAKPNNQRRDREKDDIEYERDCDECTFSPDISHVKLANYHAGRSVHSQYDSVQSAHKNGHHSSKSIFDQKGVQKSIERTKQARLNSKLTQSLQIEGTTFSSKKRQSVETKVNLYLQQHDHHTHNRSDHKQHLHTNHGHYNRIVQASPKPHIMNSAGHESHEFNPNLTGEEDSGRHGGESVEYFLKQPSINQNNSSNNNNGNSTNESDKLFSQNANPTSQNGNSGTQKTIEEDRVPLLFVDVNIEDGKTARIIVYEGERSEDLASKFAQEHNLDSVMTGRLKDLLDQQINSLLTKIDEEVGSDHDEEEEEEEEEDEDENESKQDDHHKDHEDQLPSHHGIQDEEDEQDENYNENLKRAGRMHENNGNGDQNEEEENSDQQNHVVYTEENFDYLTGSHPRGYAQHNGEDDDEYNTVEQDEPPQQQVAESNGPAGMTEDEIREMQMRAMAVTFKNFSDQEHKNEQSSHQVDEAPAAAVSTHSSAAFGGGQSQQQNSHDVMEMHMRALATTFKNYSENDEKQKTLPKEPAQQAVTSSDIENMHMRALAATYNNYAHSEEKQKQLPTEQVNAVNPSDVENMHMRALAATFNNYNNDAAKASTLPTDTVLTSQPGRVESYLNYVNQQQPQQQQQYIPSSISVDQYANPKSSNTFETKSSAYLQNTGAAAAAAASSLPLPSQSQYSALSYQNSYLPSSTYQSPSFQNQVVPELTTMTNQQYTPSSSTYVPVQYQQQPSTTYATSTSNYQQMPIGSQTSYTGPSALYVPQAATTTTTSYLPSQYLTSTNAVTSPSYGLPTGSSYPVENTWSVSGVTTQQQQPADAMSAAQAYLKTLPSQNSYTTTYNNKF